MQNEDILDLLNVINKLAKRVHDKDSIIISKKGEKSLLGIATELKNFLYEIDENPLEGLTASELTVLDGRSVLTRDRDFS